MATLTESVGRKTLNHLDYVGGLSIQLWAALRGISLPVVQVGGGLIVIATGWAMLKQKDENERGAVQCTVSNTDVLREAFYPLTLPLTVGPGSISVAITLGANEPRRLGASLLAILGAATGCALVAATIYLCYGFADRLAVVIGHGLSQLLSSLPR